MSTAVGSLIQILNLICKDIRERLTVEQFGMALNCSATKSSLCRLIISDSLWIVWRSQDVEHLIMFAVIMEQMFAQPSNCHNEEFSSLVASNDLLKDA